MTTSLAHRTLGFAAAPSAPGPIAFSRLVRVEWAKATDTRAARWLLALTGLMTAGMVLVPVLVPLLALSGWVAAPIGIALCVFAVVNGVVSLKRFWGSDHPKRWMYTWFMAAVFVVLAFALVSDLSRLGGLS